MEPKSKPISMIEFNHIFNPNKLDIPQLLDAYLRTLHLGELSKGVKGKMGGKKQKKASRNRKRSHKQKTKRRHVYRNKKTHRCRY